MHEFSLQSVFCNSIVALTCAEGTEVLGRLRDDVGTKLHDDAACRLSADGDVEVNLGVGPAKGELEKSMSVFESRDHWTALLQMTHCSSKMNAVIHGSCARALGSKLVGVGRVSPTSRGLVVSDSFRQALSSGSPNPSRNSHFTLTKWIGLC